MVGFGGENTLSVVEVDSKFDNEGSEIVLFLLKFAFNSLFYSLLKLKTVNQWILKNNCFRIKI